MMGVMPFTVLQLRAQTPAARASLVWRVTGNVDPSRATNNKPPCSLLTPSNPYYYLIALTEIISVL